MSLIGCVVFGWLRREEPHPETGSQVGVTIRLPYALQAKANETVATARAAAAENRDQLKQRVEKAQDDASQAMQDTKQQANEAVDRAQSK